MPPLPPQSSIKNNRVEKISSFTSPFRRAAYCGQPLADDTMTCSLRAEPPQAPPLRQRPSLDRLAALRAEAAPPDDHRVSRNVEGQVPEVRAGQKGHGAVEPVHQAAPRRCFGGAFDEEEAPAPEQSLCLLHDWHREGRRPGCQDALAGRGASDEADAQGWEDVSRCAARRVASFQWPGGLTAAQMTAAQSLLTLCFRRDRIIAPPWASCRRRCWAPTTWPNASAWTPSSTHCGRLWYVSSHDTSDGC